MFGIVQHLRSNRAGARPGDGTVRSLLDGELFLNTADAVMCTLAANGVMLTTPILDPRILPTTPPATSGLPWLNNGSLSFSGS